VRGSSVSSMVRPAVTMMLVVIFCALVVIQYPVPDVFSTLVISVVSYWFGERSRGK